MINISNNNYWLKQQFEFSPYQTALLTNDKIFSYKELFELSQISLNHLIAEGVGKNDKVLIVSNDVPKFFIAINSLWLLGAVPIPISNKLTARELEKMIIHSSSNFIIDPAKIYNFNDYKDIKSVDLKFSHTEKNYRDSKKVEFNPSRTCLMMHTSGSTGHPKCVQFSFNNIFESAYSSDSYINHSIYDKWLVSLPVHHIGGFSILTRSLLTGCSLIIPKSLKNEDLVNSIKSFNPSLISCVPFMVRKLVDELRIPWKNLRHLFLGGGPVTAKVVENALNDDWPISVVYGSTETSSMISVSSPENSLKNGISAGKPLEGVKISIDKQNDDMKDFGRIIINSKSVADSYFNLSGEIENDIKGETYYSRDIGKIDDKGNLHILGRMDEIIISGGENISLLEIENLLHQNIEFADCKVFGIKHEKWDHSYIIVSESKEERIEKKIHQFLSDRVAKYKLPFRIIILDRIPKNELGKVSKNELKKILNIDFL